MVSDISWTSFKISLAMIPVTIIYFLLLWRIFFGVHPNVRVFPAIAVFVRVLRSASGKISAFHCVAHSLDERVPDYAGIRHDRHYSGISEQPVDVFKRGHNVCRRHCRLHADALYRSVALGAYATIINTHAMLFNLGFRIPETTLCQPPSIL